jgi:G:T-mismatch repair DNA endonuclease (very short patch repair protein)
VKGQELLEKFNKDETIPFRDIYKNLNRTFPDFMYQFCEINAKTPEKRGHNQQNAVIAYLLDLPIEDIIAMNIKRRGLFISKGQKASPKCIENASKMGSQMLSKWRVTKPQKALFEMVKKYDKKAVMEYRVKCFDRYRSFDIYSPRINTLIEMHGRVWHDHTKEKLRELVTKNIKNDEFKKKIAEEIGKALVVFWDDQQEAWEETLRRVYEEAKGEKC